MKKNIKKLIITLLVVIFIFSVSFTQALAADDIGPWYLQNYKEWYLKVYDDSNPTEIFGERYTATQVQWVLYGIIAFIMNQTIDPALNKCLIQKGKNLSDCAPLVKQAAEKLISYDNNKSLNAIQIVTQNPISFISYLRNIERKLNPIKEAKAQSTNGYGFQAASSIQGLWQISRDISYILLILVVIAFAFMIMFRVKISPQAVITVQSALPKVVIALILITFSYAIAGFLIDLMYVVIGLISVLLAGKVSTFQAPELFKALTTDRSIFSLMVYYLFTFSIAAFFAFLSGNALFAGFMSLIAIITIIVAIIILFFAYFKILWLLIKTYTMIVLQIVIAPFQILIGTINQNSGFGSWLKNMVSLLSVFPTVGLMFFLSFVFLRGVFDSTTLFGIDLNHVPGFDWLITHLMPFNIKGGFLEENPWNAPLTVGEGAVAIIYLFVSFTIITLIPKTADIIKSMIEGKPFGYGSAIGEAVQPARTAAGGAFAGRYAYYTTNPPAETSGLLHKLIGGLYSKATPQARSMIDQTAKTIQSSISGKP